MANTQQLAPTPEPKTEQSRFVDVLQEDGTIVKGALPPITSIVLPKTTTKSSLIRWLHLLGYPTKEIYVFLGVKYQMVRNIITTEPKRAAREDTPPLVVEYKPVADELQDALDGALEESLMAERRERKKAHREGLNNAIVEGEDDEA